MLDIKRIFYNHLKHGYSHDDEWYNDYCVDVEISKRNQYDIRVLVTIVDEDGDEDVLYNESIPFDCYDDLEIICDTLFQSIYAIFNINVKYKV